MEFWGVEVKSGQTVTVEEDEDRMMLHLSHATLGESKSDKTKDSVIIHMKVNDQSFVLGSMSSDKPQLTFDLVLDRRFELSHNWKNGSLYFMGYKQNGEEDISDYGTASSEDDDDVPVLLDNGKVEAKAEPSKPATAKADKPETSEKTKAKAEDSLKKDKAKVDKMDEDDSDDDDDDSDEDDSDSDDDDEKLGDASEDDSEGEDSSDEEAEDTPKKVEPSKKRGTESASKTPVPSKKAKFTSPQKTDAKKGVHTATPYPKQGGKTAADNKKSDGKNAQTPKSAGKFVCGPCSKTFNTDGALQSHTKAKHSAAK